MYYIKSFNATTSYQKVYGVDYVRANAHGYKLLSNEVVKKIEAYEGSYEVAMVNGGNLLRNTEVKEEINKLKAAKLNIAMLEPEDVFQILILFLCSPSNLSQSSRASIYLSQ